jgi:hypothetical protein
MALPGHPSIQRIAHAHTRTRAHGRPPRFSHAHRCTLVARYRCATGQGRGNLASTRTPLRSSPFRGAPSGLLSSGSRRAAHLSRPTQSSLSPAAPGHDSTVIVSRNRPCLSLLLRRNRKCSIAAKRSVCFSCVWPVTAKPQQPFLPRCVFTAVRNQARVHGTEQTDTGHANAGSCHAQTRRWLDDDNRSASPNLFQGRNKSRGDTRVAAHIITHNHPSHDLSRSHNVSLLSQ